MPKAKTDFNAIRQRLDFRQVLAHYQVEGSEKGGGQFQGFCPLPLHAHKGEGGKPRSPSLSVNLSRGIFHCFGCEAKGNVLEFIVKMEGFNPEIGEDFRKGALMAERLFLNGGATQSVASSPTPATTAAEAVEIENDDREVVVNQPLDFVLEGLDSAHPYLSERGFSPATIEHFGLGYASRGIMKGRIAIPVNNPRGELVGYAGRLADDALIDDKNPKYKFPGERVKDGKRYAFRKSELLYHADELRRVKCKRLYVVEGFPSVWWFWQQGIKNVAAVMGASISERQAELALELTTSDARIVLIPDGDSAGERLAGEALKRLSPHRFVRWCRLDDGKQPTDIASDERERWVTEFQ